MSQASFIGYTQSWVGKVSGVEDKGLVWYFKIILVASARLKKPMITMRSIAVNAPPECYGDLHPFARRGPFLSSLSPILRRDDKADFPKIFTPLGEICDKKRATRILILRKFAVQLIAPTLRQGSAQSLKLGRDQSVDSTPGISSDMRSRSQDHRFGECGSTS